MLFPTMHVIKLCFLVRKEKNENSTILIMIGSPMNVLGVHNGVISLCFLHCDFIEALPLDYSSIILPS